MRLCAWETNGLPLRNLFPFPGHTVHLSLTVGTLASSVPQVLRCLLSGRRKCKAHSYPRHSSWVLSDQSSSHIVQEEALEPCFLTLAVTVSHHCSLSQQGTRVSKAGGLAGVILQQAGGMAESQRWVGLRSGLCSLPCPSGPLLQEG